VGGRRIGDEKLKSRVIGEAAERLAGLAKDTRNLIHPGKALRSGQIVQQNNGAERVAEEGLFSDGFYSGVERREPQFLERFFPPTRE
jgi:hypothetical protein